MNIAEIRSQTSGCASVLHFNNAGASLMPDPVRDAVIEYLIEESNFGGYETAEARYDELNQVYASIADLINAKPDEIAILENATSAWNMAFWGISFQPGDRILTSVSEYASNYISYLKLKEKIDIDLEVIPNDEYGQTSVQALKKKLDDSVKLISITHIPTNSGLVNPAEKIGTIAKEHGILYLLDACQSIGQYPVDVNKIGCDMLSATGRKYLRAPRGTGFLYVREKILNKLSPPFPDLHAAEWKTPQSFEVRKDARQFENWESNYAAVIGLKKAVEYADSIGIDFIWSRIRQLATKLRTSLASINKIDVHDQGEIKCGIVTFTVSGFSARNIKELLKSYHINVSVSTQNSTLIDMKNRNLKELVRASVHYYNTEKEIAEMISVLKSI